MNLITQKEAAQFWQTRPAESHKGSFGHALLCCGSSRYRGAARLASEGCARMGAGLVTLAATERVLCSVLPALPEIICLPLAEGTSGSIEKSALAPLVQEAQKATALLFGCGIGQTEDALFLLRGILSETTCPLVLDADGLNLLAKLPPVFFGDRICVLTPHPGELARLTGWEPQAILSDPAGAAALAAKAFGCVVLCKTHRTVIALPNGQLWQNTTGNAGLARGGSGDYLAGMITALLAQGKSAEHAALLGVYLHGAAADLCAKKLGQTTMLPHDLSIGLAALFCEMENIL